jgi:hypothetical protein
MDNEERLQEAREEECREKLYRNDYDALIESFDLSEETTLGELQGYLSLAEYYGWNITINDLLDIVI